MAWRLHILGTNAAVPTRNRHPSAQVLETEHESFLIDCGEGTQSRMIEFGVKRSRVNHIFISHLHGDHIFGLPGLLMSTSLFGRIKPLHVYGPIGIRSYLESIIGSIALQFNFKLTIHEHSDTEPIPIYDSKHISVSTIPLDHRIATTGYLFREERAMRRLRPDAIAKYDIPYDDIPNIQAGEDYLDSAGHIIANTLLTTHGKSPLSFAYCSDTAYYPEITSIIKGVDILYHEATFLIALAEEAKLRKHSTAAQAAQIASLAAAKKLLLGHFSSRYDNLDLFLEEAKPIFENTYISYEGQQFTF